MSYLENADIEYDQNNGTLSIRPGSGGRLASLVLRRNSKEDERSWVFGDSHTYEDENGDERTDHHRRGACMGTHDEGLAFLKMCRELGLSVNGSKGHYVPLSNGSHAYGLFSRKGASYDNMADRFSDYDTDELSRLRHDLPSCEQLTKLIESMAAA